MIIGRCHYQPVLLTSALVTLLFCWMRRLTSPGWSYLLALIAAFCTMLWPYAYIGLEVKQSLALLLAAYLGLTHQGKISWSRSLLFALSCAVAVSVKSSGTFLVPAILFLVACFYRHDSFEKLRDELPKLVATLAIIGTVFLSSYAERGRFAAYGGQGRFFRFFLVDGVTRFLLQVIGIILGRPTKGLSLQAPIVLIALLALPRVLKEKSALAIFTLLTLAGLVGGHALLTGYTEDRLGDHAIFTAPLHL